MGDSSETPGEEAAESTADRVVVLNPVAGTGDHAVEVRSRAAERGFDVVETTEEVGATTLTERAAGTASLVAACGGDGTVNEVVRGLVAADALEETTFGVVPAGTGNNFADKIGVGSIAHAFDVLDGGERRRIDLGMASTGGDGRSGDGTSGDGGSGDAALGDSTSGDSSFDNGTSERPFVNSCICGLTAEASADTDHEQKREIGTLAYIFNVFREAQEFDPIPLRVDAGDEIASAWDGDVIAVLVGNGRRFPAEGTAQADMEDGLLEVTILEDRPTLEVVGEEARRRFLDVGGDHVTRFRTPSLAVTVGSDEPASFSLDGEMLSASRLSLAVDRRRLRLPVGDGYDPNPDD